MQTIIIIFSILSIISALIVAFVLYKKLRSQNEKLKLIIPVLIALLVGIIFCLFGLRTPTPEFGRFM